jgi:TatD DNase family protein
METFIDSHCHLADPVFAGDRDAVIERAKQAGAAALICIGASLDQAHQSEQLAHQYPGLIAWTAGIHPHDAAEWQPSHADALRSYLQRDAVAVGECGLDYHYDHSPRDVQRRVFAAQLALAKEYGKPVIVHTRDAEDDTQAMITEAGKSGILGVLHCYTGTHTLAKAALDIGWYISFSGIITFKNWTDDAILRLVPTDRLLTESDSPYLAPVPNRGKRNEPTWVPQTIAKLAAVRNQSITDVARETAHNARTLFSLHAN